MSYRPLLAVCFVRLCALCGVRVVSKEPQITTEALPIPRIQIEQADLKEPTSGLEPLTCFSYECAVSGC
jgi:hypothetical protein